MHLKEWRYKRKPLSPQSNNFTSTYGPLGPNHNYYSVVPEFTSKTKYSSYVCPMIIYSTHTDIKCSQITKCHE
jgi:hypothetical protein